MNHGYAKLKITIAVQSNWVIEVQDNITTFTWMCSIHISKTDAVTSSFTLLLLLLTYSLLLAVFPKQSMNWLAFAFFYTFNNIIPSSFKCLVHTCWVSFNYFFLQVISIPNLLHNILGQPWCIFTLNSLCGWWGMHISCKQKFSFLVFSQLICIIRLNAKST